MVVVMILHKQNRAKIRISKYRNTAEFPYGKSVCKPLVPFLWLAGVAEAGNVIGLKNAGKNSVFLRGSMATIGYAKFFQGESI